MTYKFLPHTADVKILAEAKTIEQGFSEAAMALKEAIAEDVDVRGKIEKKFEVKGKDYESLLYNFLEEFLYLLDAEGFLLGDVKEIEIFRKGDVPAQPTLKVDKKVPALNHHTELSSLPLAKLSKLKKLGSSLKLHAKVVGDKASNYKFTNDVKAVTYNEMFVKEEKGKFKLQFVLDV